MHCFAKERFAPKREIESMNDRKAHLISAHLIDVATRSLDPSRSLQVPHDGGVRWT